MSETVTGDNNVDEWKLLAERFAKTLFSSIRGGNEDEDDGEDQGGKLNRDIWSQTLGRAGRGKDELIRILGREIGLAAAAVLAEPLARFANNKQLRITIELVPRSEEKGEPSAPSIVSPRPRKPKSTKKAKISR